MFYLAAFSKSVNKSELQFGNGKLQFLQNIFLARAEEYKKINIEEKKMLNLEFHLHS